MKKLKPEKLSTNISSENTKILTVVGARPQFIKASALSRCINETAGRGSQAKIEEDILHTGQHYEYRMNQLFFKEMGVPEPRFHLGVGSDTHGRQTANMIEGIECVLMKYKYHAVLIYGDTNSTLAAALAASKLHIPVIHVEAGLRSYNRLMPEEINRVLTDHVSELLFCPSESSRRNLKKEGITNGVYVVGDIMYDVFLHHINDVRSLPNLEPFILATIHRAENTDDENNFREILNALEKAPMPVIFPAHPRLKKMLSKISFLNHSNIQFRDPMGYLEILSYLKSCSFVVTDSGGLQKEAYFSGKKCVTVRNETEWVELVELGFNRICGTSRKKIVEAFHWACSAPVNQWKKIYGDGNTAQKIYDIMYRYFVR